MNMSSDDQAMDQSQLCHSALLEQGSSTGGQTRPSHWDVKPSLPILLIWPIRDVSRGLQSGGPTTGTGFTSRQPQVDPQEERKQIAERDQRVQKEQELQITAGSVAEPISHLHLQEPVAPATIQPQRYMNEVRTTELDMLIQRTARPEPPRMLLPREQQTQLRLHREWAGKPTFGHSQPFSKPPFSTSMSRMLSE